MSTPDYEERFAQGLANVVLGDTYPVPADPSVTYSIAKNGLSIMCLRCGKASFNQGDIRELYCGNCHEFHKRAE